MDDKQEFRREVFECMCEFVGFGFFIRESQIFFKPGISDKMLFNNILNEVFDVCYRDNIRDKVNAQTAANHIMRRFYYPRFGEYNSYLMKIGEL